MIRGNYAYLPGGAVLGLNLTAQNSRFSRTSLVQSREIDLADDALAVSGVGGLELFDLANPTTLVARGTFGLAGDIAVSGRRVVATDFANGGLHVIESAAGTNLVETGVYPSDGFGNVALAGNYAVVAHGSRGLTILDLGPSFAAAPKVTFQPQRRRVLPQGSAKSIEALDRAQAPHPRLAIWQHRAG